MVITPLKLETHEYSAPFTLAGKTLWLRATDAAVALFEDYRLVVTRVASVQASGCACANTCRPRREPASAATRPGVPALLKPYGAARLEAACARTLAHGSPYYRTVKTISATGADQHAEVPVVTTAGYSRTNRISRRKRGYAKCLAGRCLPLGGQSVTGRRIGFHSVTISTCLLVHQAAGSPDGFLQHGKHGQLWRSLIICGICSFFRWSTEAKNGAIS